MTVMGKRDPKTLVGNASGRWCGCPWGAPVGAFVLQKSSLTCRSWLFSPLSLFGNCLHLIHVASWAGSSSLCSLNSRLLLSLLQFWCFIRQFLLHLSILPSGVLIVKIFVIYFTVRSPVCLLHYFIHQQNYLPYIELRQQWGFWIFSPQLCHNAATGFVCSFLFNI